MGVLNLRGFPDDLQDLLRIEAAKRKTPMKDLVAQAVREWLEREAKASKEKPKRKDKG